MASSKREGLPASTWHSGGDAGAFVCRSQPSTTLWLFFGGPPSNLGRRQASVYRQALIGALTALAHDPFVPEATPGRMSSPACARAMSHGKDDEDDISSPTALRASARKS